MLEQAQNTFNFELVSPEAKLISEDAWQVVVPGEEGDIGVLPNHSPWVVSVRPGVVTFYKEEGAEPQKIFVAGGFADISATNCTILAEEAVNVNDLSQETLQTQIANLTEDLTLVEGIADQKKVEKSLAIAKAKLSAVIGRIVA